MISFVASLEKIKMPKLSANISDIIVAHCFSAIALADKIVVVQDGKITDIGTHKELLKYDNWYKMQYLIQIKGDNHEEL